MIREAIALLVARESLSQGEARAVMEEIMSGNATPAQISAFLVALRMKGETVDEITGCAEAMREKVRRISVTDPEAVMDTCGTGGDEKRTFNISTAAALVAAGAGVKIAKHGNRSVSSSCGSADVLEALGVKLDAPPEVAERSVAEVGFGFLFAPLLHPAMKYAAAPRREIGIRTLFNILGPLTNPAGARRQLLGVFRSGLTDTVARVLLRLGSVKALVVHSSDGLDEISPAAVTHGSLLENGTISSFDIDPRQYGLKHESLDPLIVSSKEEAARMMRAVLEGERSVARDATLLNAAAAIIVSGKAASFADGLELAARSIDSGKAAQVLREVVRLSRC